MHLLLYLHGDEIDDRMATVVSILSSFVLLLPRKSVSIQNPNDRHLHQLEICYNALVDALTHFTDLRTSHLLEVLLDVNLLLVQGFRCLFDIVVLMLVIFREVYLL